MNKKRVLGAAAAAMMAVTSTSMTALPASAADNLVVSPYSAYQINNGVFEGWGTSLCWWANRVGYSDSLAKQTAELFFGDTGLRMNIARYNIGGGDDPTHNHITRTDSDIPGYTVYNNGNVTYDWNADANQRNVLMKSIDACKDGLIVEMFSNSPPYYMTQSGCSSGNKDGGKNNLKDDCYDDFAEYFAKVCDYYQNTLGVNIQSAAPMNEPYTNFWYAGSPKQEGCHFDIGNCESKILTELDAALKRYGLDNIIISASDETSIDTTIDAFNALSADAKKVVGRIDTHTYGGSKRGQLRDLALKNNRNLWMSEVDGGATAGSNNGQMGAALWLAERMSIDLNGMNPSAWILWQAIDKHICAAGLNGKKDSGMPDINGGFWGLAVADHDKDTVVLTQKYYAFGQFSRYIRPGMTMLNMSGTNVAAFDKENGRVIIVATNTSGSNKEVHFDLSQFETFGKSAQVIRTSGDMNTGEHWKELSPIATDSTGFNATVMGNSVTTYIIEDVTAVSLDFDEIPVNAKNAKGSAAWKDDASHDYTKAFDGDLSTYFDGLGGGYVQIDLGGSYDLAAIGVAPRSGYAYRCADAVISVSADGTNWKEAYQIPSVPFEGLNYYTKLKEKTGVRYVRYKMPDGAPTNPANKDSSYCCNIAELKIYGTPSGLGDKIDVTPDMVTGSDPWNNSSNDCKKVVDGNTATYFDGVGNGWVQIDLGTPYELSTIAYAPRSGYAYRCTNAVISGSNDGKTWTKLASIDSTPGDGMNYLTLSSPAAYRYVRYQVPDGKPTNADNPDNVCCCNLAEIALYGTKAEGTVLRGDANADGKLSVADAVMLQKWLLTSGDITAWENADMDGDGKLTARDFTLLKAVLLA